MTTASRPALAIIASGSAHPRAPVWPTAAASVGRIRVGDGGELVATEGSTTRRWFRPIDPRPARPMRSGASAVTVDHFAGRGGDPAHGGDDGRQVVGGQPRVDRDREHFVRQCVRDRQVEIGGAGQVRLEVCLAMDRHRVVDERADAPRGQSFDHARPLARESASCTGARRARGPPARAGVR